MTDAGSPIPEPDYPAILSTASHDLRSPLATIYGFARTIERIAPLERAILRTALLEMLHPDLVEGERPIPPEGAIDEAVETAKRFCGAEAPGFVNGILNAVLREMRETAEHRG